MKYIYNDIDCKTVLKLATHMVNLGDFNKSMIMFEIITTILVYLVDYI